MGATDGLTEDDIQAMQEADAEAFLSDMIREMEEAGASDTQIQAFLLRGAFAPGLTTQSALNGAPF